MYSDLLGWLPLPFLLQELIGLSGSLQAHYSTAAILSFKVPGLMTSEADVPPFRVLFLSLHLSPVWDLWSS